MASRRVAGEPQGDKEVAMAWFLLLWTAVPPPLVAEAADTLVVSPAPLVTALQPWIVHRTRQGHRVQLVVAAASREAIRATIRQIARQGRLRHVLLVGDAGSSDGEHAAAAGDCRLPAGLVPAKVNVAWGSEPEIATDNWYADLDDDQLPDVAIGRLCVDSPEELQIQVRKILLYEKYPGPGLWQRQINLVAGIGSFGAVTDTVLEMATKKFLTGGIPAAYQTTMTYASWQSPYCPDPRRFREATLFRLNEGCLFWIYIGHGQQRFLAPVRVPGAAFPILDVDDAARLNASSGPPIAILLACYTGAFDQAEDCLAEALLRAEGGPVAAICGSRVTMPYGMAVMSDALLDEYFVQRRATLGELLLAAKRRMVTDAPDNSRRQLLDALAAAFSPSGDQLSAERLEHVALFNLLGDPLLRLPHARPIEIRVADVARSGQSLTVSGRCELAGEGWIELVCRRDRTRVNLASRRQFEPTHEFLISFQDTYREANDSVWAAQPFTSTGGNFDLQLVVPPDCTGPCHVRACLAAPDGFALGAADVFVQRPTEEPRPLYLEAGKSPEPARR